MTRGRSAFAAGILAIVLLVSQAGAIDGAHAQLGGYEPLAVVANITVAPNPDIYAFFAGTYDPVNGLAYLANYGSTLSVIETANNTLLTPVQLPTNCIEDSGITFDPSNGMLYVSCLGTSSNYTAIVNTATDQIVAEVSVGEYPTGEAYDAANGLVYVANSGSGNISEISTLTNTVIGSIVVGVQPHNIAVDDLTGQIFVGSINSTRLTVIDGSTNAVVDKIPLPPGLDPIGVYVDSAHDMIYVSADCPPTLIAISGSTFKISFETNPGPTWNDGPCDPLDPSQYTTDVSMNPSSGLIFFNYAPGGWVAVIDSNTQVLEQTIGTGTYPSSLVFDSTNDLLYVLKYHSVNLSVIGPAPSVEQAPGSSSSFWGLSTAQWQAALVGFFVGFLPTTAVYIWSKRRRRSGSR